MREDIYKKEREIYDLKNQINLHNLKLTKEAEARTSAEDALKKNNDKFQMDVEKYTSSLKNINKENETLAQKLQESEKQLY
mmetsp:Transcript_8939/g.7804  ORF Transcript_8939/g.7804 Transcript_8939/m.7804 type:complete len:81 (+) Transcript_8939:196-438(+)